MTNSTVDTIPLVSTKKSSAKQIQSIEPKIADLVNGWLKSYRLRYFLEQEKINLEIDEAFEKAPQSQGEQEQIDLIRNCFYKIAN